MDEKVHWVMDRTGEVHAVTLPDGEKLTNQYPVCAGGYRAPEGEQQWRVAEIETLKSFCPRCLAALAGALVAWDE